MKLVEAMRQGGMHPDLYSFNTAISACQKVRARLAWYSWYTTRCCVVGAPVLTDPLIQIAPRNPTNTDPTIQPPNQNQAGKVRQITRLLARMEEDFPPVPPNAYTFITATTACLQAGAFDKLFEVRFRLRLVLTVCAGVR